MRLILLVILLFKSSFTFSQQNSPIFFRNDIKNIFFDSGKNWDLISTFDSKIFDVELNKKDQNSFIRSRNELNFSATKTNYSFSGFTFLEYRKNFFVYYFPSIEFENPNVSPIKNPLMTQNRKSGFGYKSSWVLLQIGRGNESWGSGEEINLALTEYSDLYDYLLISSDYGSLRVRYIHGFLENIKNNINRYITARGIEWTNKKSLLLSLTETIIYSGKNRPLDIGYLNPISFHLEAELNNRLNTFGNSRANAVWQAHMDILLDKKLRISLNILFDELVLDPSIQSGKENGKAYSMRISYVMISTNERVFTTYCSLIYVGTPTFRHLVGDNNFVQNGKPLGWHRGSDGRQGCIGFKSLIDNKFLLKANLGLFQIGNESISERAYDPYLDYLKGPFPSGNYTDNYYLETSFTYQRGNNLITNEIYFSEKGSELNLRIARLF